MKVSRGWLLASLLLAAPVCAQSTTEAYFPPFDDAESHAMALLDTAQHTLDIAQYNIRNERFFTKLQQLRARGVRIRIVVDAKNAEHPWNTLDDKFVADGFDLVRFRNTNSNYAIMHHKFTVIDDAVVMTGSYNWNETAQIVNDENMVVLRDPAIAAAYAAEFRELRGASEQGAPPASSLGHAYFSPEDHVRDKIVAEINAAQRTIRVAMFTLTDRDVARALRDAARRGVAVTVLVEKKQADHTHADETVASGGARVIVGANRSSTYSAMHEKFAVIDDQVVITGACNWTYTAFNYSNEDVLILRDPTLVTRYTQAFGSLVRRYAPTGWSAADYGISRPEGGVNFVLQMPRTQPGDQLVVTGNHPLLGNWDPAHGVSLRTMDGLFPTWGASVHLPAGTRLEWKAVVRRVDGSVRWEIGANRVTTIDPSGADEVIDVGFRDLVPVTITAHHPSFPTGSELRLVGADPLLGSWDPTLGYPLAAVQTGGVASSEDFSVTLDLHGGASVQCKLVVVAPDGTVTWESGGNRALAIHDQASPQQLDLGDFRP